MEEQASSHIHTIRKYRVREEVGKWGNGEMGKWGNGDGTPAATIYSFTRSRIFPSSSERLRSVRKSCRM